MIRPFKTTDLDSIMQIWLSSNIDTHDYIPESYWISNYESVKKIIPNADLYILEENNRIGGFMGIMEGYIAGIFVRKELRSQGFGHTLLSEAKARYPKLTLSVYSKNSKAIKFYQREEFHITSASIDKDTGEEEVLMQWEA
ncbi:MAG: GNAT family N-acetyltransferase [Bacteroidales bacterium]